MQIYFFTASFDHIYQGMPLFLSMPVEMVLLPLICTTSEDHKQSFFGITLSC